MWREKEGAFNAALQQELESVRAEASAREQQMQQQIQQQMQQQLQQQDEQIRAELRAVRAEVATLRVPVVGQGQGQGQGGQQLWEAAQKARDEAAAAKTETTQIE